MFQDSQVQETCGGAALKRCAEGVGVWAFVGTGQWLLAAHRQWCIPQGATHTHRLTPPPPSRSAVDALKGGEGGRLHAFLCSLPRRGAMHLRLRDVGRPPTDRDNLDSLLPESKEYQVGRGGWVWCCCKAWPP